MPTTDFYLACTEKVAPKRGTILLKEGDKSDEILIIRSGDVEVVKTNLKYVYFNQNTGIIGLREGNPKGALLKSDVQLIQPDLGVNEGPAGISSLAKYTGSEFHMDV